MLKEKAQQIPFTAAPIAASKKRSDFANCLNVVSRVTYWHMAAYLVLFQNISFFFARLPDLPSKILIEIMQKMFFFLFSYFYKEIW